ncbi:MAG: rhodanese-like domain-containing protein [Gammaproteobacteria bacterium]|nr:rhodanese-like domain-containing protein [Gammaproteobacteria bacterium]MDH3559341.1 rhodanese-like domain-containing protein [Gammaproteobacteria bacterium]
MDFNQLNEFVTNHLLLVMAFVVLLSVLAGGELKRRISGVQQITPAEATRLLNHENAVMIDMRNDKEYRNGHIVNAVHVPVKDRDIDGRLDKYRDRPLIVYCNNGNQSTQLCGKLRKQGFEPVYNLKGGVLAWQRSELPLTRGK